MITRKLAKSFIILYIAILIAIFLSEYFFYRQQIGDEFYTSAIPNDPVKLGMKPHDVKSVLGKPDDEIVMGDYFQKGFAGNEFEWRHTGEIILEYNMEILNANAFVDYSYYKKDGIIDDVWAHIPNYETIDDATASLDKLVRYAEMIFEKKGDYTFEVSESSYDSYLTYIFKSKNRYFKFRYEVSIGNSNKNDKPYYINVYQSLYRNRDGYDI